MTWTKALDEAAVLATKSGYWHIILFYLLCALASIPTSFLVFSQVFTNATPEHWCAPPPELNELKIPEEQLRSWTVPNKSDNYENCKTYGIETRVLYAVLQDYVDEKLEYSHEGGSMKTVKTLQLVRTEDESQRNIQIDRVEKAIQSIRSKEFISCPYGWIYNQENYHRTLVTEFNLVCEKEWLPRMSNTLFWVGSIFGNVFFGWMSDRYGRRPTILLMILLEVPLAIVAAFSQNYWAYTALRVAGGLFFPALYQLPFILALELMPPKKRTYTGIVVGMLFATGMCLLALLAYLCRDWFYLSLATSLPFITLYGYYWLIPESPRWLVGRGRVAEAEKVFRNLAKKNGIDLPRGFLLELNKKMKELEDANLYMGTPIFPNANGHAPGYIETLQKDEYADRRISNMLTFKPDLSKISESDESKDSKQSEGLERILALEVAEIVNKKSRLKKEQDRNNEIFTETKDDVNEESHLNCELQVKATQTDPFKTPNNSLRRKSIQLVAKMFAKSEDDDYAENKIMDDQNSEGDCKASFLDVFRYPNIRKKFFILTFDWVTLGVVYNSLSYNTPNFGVNDYLAFFIGGAVELPSYFIAWRCMEQFGRRWVLCIFMCVGGVACISCVFVPESWPWITLTLAMLGRLCAAASFAVFYVFIGELLPTVLRAQAMAAASFISGLGLLTCPYIVHLAMYYKPLPLIIMGFLSFIGGFTSLFLPETLNQPLPQTLGDGEIFGRKFKVFSCVEKPRDVEYDY